MVVWKKETIYMDYTSGHSRSILKLVENAYWYNGAGNNHWAKMELAIISLNTAIFI